MFKKLLPIVFIGLCVVVAVLVLGWNVFVKREMSAPVKPPVIIDDNNQNSGSGEVVDDSSGVGDDVVVDDDISNPDDSEIDSDISKIDTFVYKVIDLPDKFLLIERFHLYSMKAPYSDLSDTIRDLNILKNDKPIVLMRANTWQKEYKLVGDRIYFFDHGDNIVKYMDFEGNIHELTFTKMIDFASSECFAVSSDNQKIAWAETTFENNATNNTSKLIVADIDGKNKKVILEKNFEAKGESSKFLHPIKWSNSNEEIYFTEQQGGLGGYFVFFNPINLSKINIYTSKIKYSFDEGRVGDISPNEKFISYFAWREYKPKSIIRNLETGTENVFDIPIEENFKLGGSAYFSPDNKHLVYNIAYHDPDNERFQTVVVNSIKKEQKTIVDDSQKEYEARGWVSNDKILLRDFDNNIYTINIDGSDFKRREIIE